MHMNAVKLHMQMFLRSNHLHYQIATNYKIGLFIPIYTYNRDFFAKMVGTGRVELPTSRLSVVRSNQLSYAPVYIGRNSWMVM